LKQNIGFIQSVKLKLFYTIYKTCASHYMRELCCSGHGVVKHTLCTQSIQYHICDSFKHTE